ncbi:MAG: hypothetical protein GY777_30250 [Candidatus Brocadiaceae bacterium]|nr:hypothetical protein [Candidatus Brocadiaceae bacterium]
MNTNPMILVVGATRKENIHIEQCLMDWKYEAIPLKGEKSGKVASIPKSPGSILVYVQEEQKDTIAIFRRKLDDF